MHYLLACILCYLIGSIPTAFLLVKKRHGHDIRQKGTGNVGAMNAYEVTGDSMTGIFIAAIDISKGLIASLVALAVLGGSPYSWAIGLFFVVTGHVLSPWIGFRGGRGLAAAAGALALSVPLCAATWILLWGVVYAIRRNIGVANHVALYVLAAWSWVAPHWWWWPMQGWENTGAFRALALLPTIALVILAHRRGPAKTSEKTP